MKDLPIHLVKFREEKDVLFPEGMSKKQAPQWMTPENIKNNATRVISELELFKLHLAQKVLEKKELPMLTVVKLHKDATAKTHRKNVRGMFDLKNKRNVIGMVSKDEVLVKIDNTEDLSTMRKKFDQYKSEDAKFDTCKAIAAITDIRIYNPIVEDKLEGKSIKVRLVDYLDSQYNNKRDEEFISFCKTQHLTFQEVHYSDKMKIFKIDNVSEETISQVATMDSVISVKEMPYVEISASPEPTDTRIEVKSPNESEDYPVIGLLDSGVAPIPHLSNWIQEDNIANLDDSDITREHGTFVAGILLYGDDLERKKFTHSIPFKIQSCIVNSKAQKIYENELIGLITDSIKKYPEIKIWNLSQGSQIQVDDNKFSDFAIALDEIQDKYNILICKSAGNQDHPENGELRITQGADSVRSLVVGSISSEQLEPFDGLANCRSPFSRIGFGPDFLIKPDVVHYGGNLSTYTGVRSFSVYGNEALNRGTSFSTPRVTALAATIANRLSINYNPLLTKALIIHSASYPKEVHLSNKDRLRELGYGLPKNADEIMFNDENEFTMVFNFTLDKGKDIRSIEFPFPECLIDEEGLYYGDITLTLASNPVLNPNEGNEYCQSNVEILLQTYDHIETVDLGALDTPNYIHNRIRVKEAQNVLTKDKYSTRICKDFDNPFTPERTLIEEGFKYQPIKKYHINLEEMTPANKRKFLASSRKWGITIQAKYRDSASTDMDKDGLALSTEVALVITLKDTKNKGQVYNQGVNLLNLYNYEHNALSTRQHIRL